MNVRLLVKNVDNEKMHLKLFYVDSQPLNSPWVLSSLQNMRIGISNCNAIKHIPKYIQ